MIFSHIFIGDGCSEDCQVEVGYSCDDGSPSSCSIICGDARKHSTESCDDGNLENGFYK